MNISDQVKYIKDKKSDIIQNIDHNSYNDIISIEKGAIVDFLIFLRDDENLKFKMLIDLFGADLLGIRSPRFEVI